MISAIPAIIMTKFNTRSYLKIAIFFLRNTGLWPENFTYKLNSFYTFRLMLYAVLIAFPFVIPQVFNLYFIVNDLEAFAASFYIVMAYFNVICKGCLWIKNLPLIKTIMDILDSDLYQPRNHRQILLMDQSFKIWSIMYNTLVSASTITICLFGLFPMFMETEERQLPFLVWYPFDFRKSPYYECIYLHLVLGVYYYAMTNTSIDGFLSAIMIYIAAECEFLCDNLRDIYEYTKERLQKEGRNLDNYRLRHDDAEEDAITDEYHNSLKIFVQHHRGILKLAEDSNSIFFFIVAFQLCTSVLTTCMTLFRLATVPIGAEFFSLALYQISMFFEILIFCWCGNEATLSSEKIPSAAYESNWIGSNRQYKKSLLYLITTTQEPIRFYALSFFTLSLETFISILRMSYSYFSLLYNMNGADN